MHSSPNPTRYFIRLALAFGAALTGAEAWSAVAQPSSGTIGSIWQQHSDNPEVAWRDPTSGTRVVNLTSGFDTASVFYFHQNIFTADGDMMLFSGRRGKDQGYFSLSLKTGEIRQLTQQTGQHLVVLPRRRSAAFDRGDDVFLLNLTVARPARSPRSRTAGWRKARVSASPRMKANCCSPIAINSPTRTRSWWRPSP